MKLETYFHKVVKNHQIIFRKVPCTHARTRDVNVCAPVLSRQNARAYTYTSCARIFARIFTKNYLMFLYYLMKISIEFHKDLSFRCEDICKTILTFKNHQCSMFKIPLIFFNPSLSGTLKLFSTTITTHQELFRGF